MSDVSLGLVAIAAVLLGACTPEQQHPTSGAPPTVSSLPSTQVPPAASTTATSVATSGEPAAGPKTPDRAADCQLLAGLVDPVNEPEVWHRFEYGTIQRDVAWCGKKKDALGRLLASVQDAEEQLTVAENRSWATTARKHVERRIELVTDLCKSFATPYKNPPPKPDSRFVVKQEGPAFSPREYELFRELRLHNGKIGFASSQFAGDCPDE